MSLVWTMSISLLGITNAAGLTYITYTIIYGQVKIYQIWIATFAVVIAYSMLTFFGNFLDKSLGLRIATNLAGYILYAGISHFT